jgi:hypothetical protein
LWNVLKAKKLIIVVTVGVRRANLMWRSGKNGSLELSIFLRQKSLALCHSAGERKEKTICYSGLKQNANKDLKRNNERH